MDKWVYTIDEIFDYIDFYFRDYTLFLKSGLCKKDDGEYICGTTVITPSDFDTRRHVIDLYTEYNREFLITSIDVKNKYITFNLIDYSGKF